MNQCGSRQDVCIAGGGIIGLSLALELNRRGARVLVLDAGMALGEASSAAAGMLAAGDPENPSQMRPLAELSIALYPEYLDRLRNQSSLPIGFQTEHTLQAFGWRECAGSRRTVAATLDAAGRAASPDEVCQGRTWEVIACEHPGANFRLIKERSLDPRELAATLRAAVLASSIKLVEAARVLRTEWRADAVGISTLNGKYEAGQFVDCTGAWADEGGHGVRPVKGQMLVVETPIDLDVAVRTPEIYLVPRLRGRNAGRMLIGATVEQCGFDKAVHAEALSGLLDQAAALMPSLGLAKVLDSWAGLRPATIDGLPVIGAHRTKAGHFVASGHYRNGILLAPATAVVMADLLERRRPQVDLQAFLPGRSIVR